MNDRRLMIKVLGTTALTTLGPLLLGNPALANPQGATVVGGSVSVVQTSPTRLDINQASQNAVVNWQSFSVGAKELTNFNQPSASSLAVNRVVGVDPSTIAGQITANGRVVLTNPNGVVVSQGARIDAASFIATTSGITNQNAMAGTLAFTQGSASPTAAVVNHGQITVRQGGLAALVAPGVANDGTIQARLGKVALASGQTFTIDLNGDRLVNFAVDGQVLKQVTAPDGTPLSAAVVNAGKVSAHGGLVEISVDAAKGVVDQAINMTGIVEATTARQVAGTIVLDGGSSGLVNLTGTLNATGTQAGQSGGRISVTGNVIMHTGTIDASGAAQGGNVAITADKLMNQGRIAADSTTGNGGAITIQAASAYIDTAPSTLSAQSFGSGRGGSISVTGGASGTLFASGSESTRSAKGVGGSIGMSAGTVELVGAALDASGDTGGGSIQIGGGLHGQGTLLDATNTLVIPGTTLDANARTAGNGGSVVVWSTSSTTFAGTIDARGGAQSGNGGAVEVSSKGDLVYAGTTDLTAAAGATGTLLLDPANIVIDDTTGGVAQYQLIDPDPTPGATFGEQVMTLSNGNIVVTNPADGFAGANSGAVYLYNGQTAQLISALTGSQANDQIGSSGVNVLSNGSLAIPSPNWSNGVAASAGAITWANPTTGVAGVVSAANSLVGSHSNDIIGVNGLTSIGDGNYVARSASWNSNAGAVTWINPATPPVGVVSAANSLVGSNPDDLVGGDGVTVLDNGNYVVISTNWGSAGNFGMGLGAVTWGNAATGVSGAVSAANSVVGSNPGDSIGSNGIVQVGNSNYVIASPNWGSGGSTGFSLGAVTWVNGSNGQGTDGNVGGVVSAATSLVGSTLGDNVGSNGVTPVGNGNYLVVSPSWNNPNGFFGQTTAAGAVTWGNGNLGISGTISATNSLVGDFTNDNIGSGGIAFLTNGNYVVVSPNYQGVPDAVGAVTWGNGNTGVSGDIANSFSSLVGVNEGDNVGSGGVVALSNGNFVVLSPNWNNNLGAATWGDGTNGFLDQPTISASNSLVGATFGDQVGSGGVTQVGNSNYVVVSPNYHANTFAATAGAVTWGSGTTGVSGTISPSNSLVGSNTNDQVGSNGIVAVGDGNYVVLSPNWNNLFGAVTWVNGNTGVGVDGNLGGAVSAANSLVGDQQGDQIGGGVDGAVIALNNGNYAVSSPNWHGGGSGGFGLGAVTWGNGDAGVAGTVSGTAGTGLAPSVVGSALGDSIGSNGIAQLDNGNYVIVSPNWGAGVNGAQGLGAVTWVNGSNGLGADGNLGGVVSATNSLVGSVQGDLVGSGGITQVGNSNYVVVSSNWNNTAGAVTWGDGNAGIVGAVGAGNSIVGSNPNDSIGNFGITVLSNGNYVVRSVDWSGGMGAVTFALGSAPTAETVSAANSLVGSNTNDFVGNGGVYQVGDGNYAVVSGNWNSNTGAVTWGSGTTGVAGVVSASNSLVGSNPNDEIGAYGITTFSSGNYVIASPFWNNDAGAVTFASGNAPITGIVSAANSLVGSHNNDFVGNGGAVDLFNGSYLVLSPSWNSGAGAISIGNITTGLTGVVTASNSVVGQLPNDDLTYRYYDYQNQVLVATDGFVLPCDCDETASNTGGKVILGLSDPNLLTFDRAQDQTVTLSSTVLAQALQTADITLQANNDITFDNGVSVPTGGHSLTLDAGRSINIAANSALVFDGNFTAIANDSDPNLILAERQAGPGGIMMGTGSSIDTSLAGGAITLQIDGGGTPGAMQVATLSAGGGTVSATGGTSFTELTGSTITSGPLTITASGAVTLATINASQVLAQSGPGGDITLNGVVDPAGNNDTLVLASGGNFINNAGPNALIAKNGGRWLVYSQSPDADTLGGLVPGFIQYGATYPTTPVADAVDNGFLYSVTPVVTLTSVTKTYDGTTNLVLTPGNYTVSGALGSDTVTVAAASGNYATANAGTGIAVNISGATVNAVNGTTPIFGYQLAPADPDTIGIITPAPLTVTVNDVSRTFGSNNPTFTVTVSGLEGSDTVGSLRLAISTTAQGPSALIGASSVPAGVLSPGSSVGTYPIMANINDSNYVVVSRPGTLTITPAALDIAVANASRLYGDANPTFSGTVVSGLIGGDSIANIGLSFTTPAQGGTRTNAGSGIGMYAINALVTDANYAVTSTPGTLTINPATLTVVVSNASRDFGQPNPAVAVALSGLRGADSAASVGLSTMTAALGGNNGTGGSPPGTYALTASITNPNYVENLIPGTLTILPGATTVTAPPPFSLDQLIALLTAANNASGGSQGSGGTSFSKIALLLSTPLNELTRGQREEIAVLVNQALGNPGTDVQPFHLSALQARYLIGQAGIAGAPWLYPNGAIAQYPDAFQYLDAYLQALSVDVLPLPPTSP